MFDNKCLMGPAETQWDFEFQGLLCFHTTHSPYSLQISLLIVEMLHLYQVLQLNSLDILQRREGGKKEVFLSFLFLENKQPKIILMPKRTYFDVANVAYLQFPLLNSLVQLFCIYLVYICITILIYVITQGQIIDSSFCTMIKLDTQQVTHFIIRNHLLNIVGHWYFSPSNIFFLLFLWPWAVKFPYPK